MVVVLAVYAVAIYVFVNRSVCCPSPWIETTGSTRRALRVVPVSLAA